ncbi:hypothetical protein MKK58_06300 [Methylobacterium sp. J-078]|uniref:hypothetical protein n=1 Tax=Methylobacterium sp. J-078 TaxID=2836657 RepID=UPI001FBBA065|nr:hypothetical protein [Methylobacterium sp. J-078]MCJ2044142.1 hypothetical protein [Methylobacterium sp. J-078]
MSDALGRHEHQGVGPLDPVLPRIPEGDAGSLQGTAGTTTGLVVGLGRPSTPGCASR